MSAPRYQMIAALAAVLFRRILDGHEVVTDGDHREENRNENCDGDKLAAAIRAGEVPIADPQANDQKGKSRPREIEQYLHLVPHLY